MTQILDKGKMLGYQPAFPVSPQKDGEGRVITWSGLTKREYFAIQLASAFFRDSDFVLDESNIKRKISKTIFATDALLEELAKEQS